MRKLLTVLLVLVSLLTSAQGTLRITAPGHPGQQVLVYRYLDLFTLRTELIASARCDEQGSATLPVHVPAQLRVQLRIGEDRADLYLKPDGHYDVIFQRSASAARSVSGTAQAELLFNGMDALDINALTSDLNERLDAFIAQDLATDQASGMQVVDRQRQNGTATRDTSSAPQMLSVGPSWSEARVDTFERKLRRFYAGVDDPWFMGTLDYGVAGLRFGPRANDKALYERYLKGRPVRYDDPEYIRFLRSMFEDHLMRYPYRTYQAELEQAVAMGALDSLKRIFALHDFLRTDDRLCELVVMNELHVNYNGKVLSRAGIRTILQRLADGSAYPEHRTLAADMLWDLTAMRPGAVLPSLRLQDATGALVELDTLLKGPVLIAVTAGWCTYCEMEMSALDKLYAEYGKAITFIGIGLDPGKEALGAYLRLHPQRNWTWLHAADAASLMDALRMRSLPQFFLLNDRTLTVAPAPMPSQGLAGILHRLKTEAEEKGRIKFGSAGPAPTPPPR